jgi:DNA repair protein RadC
MDNDIAHGDLGHRGRLRERFQAAGLRGLADYEAVELLLTMAIPRRDVKPVAKRLVGKFRSFRGVLDAPIEELSGVQGVGTAAATAIKFVKEAAGRYLQQGLSSESAIDDPSAVIDYCRLSMGALPTEHFKVIYLDSAGKVVGDETLEEGTVDRASVYPREVISAALRHKASALIFVHNHPNGDVSPTEQDKVLTRSLVLAATTVQIRAIDHLIVSTDDVFSFRQEGLI